jgi:hypothetical protein
LAPFNPYYLGGGGIVSKLNNESFYKKHKEKGLSGLFEK